MNETSRIADLEKRVKRFNEPVEPLGPVAAALTATKLVNDLLKEVQRLHKALHHRDH